MSLYFAYGSNLWKEQMADRCPNHECLGVGVLRGYKWIISKRGYATIIKSPDDYVLGRVYRLTESDEEKLDIKEGVHKGLYRKEVLGVFLGETPLRCLVYIDRETQEGNPKNEYIERMNKGLSEANLPDEYVNRYIRPFVPE